MQNGDESEDLLVKRENPAVVNPVIPAAPVAPLGQVPAQVAPVAPLVPVAPVAQVAPVVPVDPVIQQQAPVAEVVAQAPQVPIKQEIPVKPAPANSVADDTVNEKNFPSLKIDAIVDQDSIDSEMSRIALIPEKPAMKTNPWEVAKNWIRPRLICNFIYTS